MKNLGFHHIFLEPATVPGIMCASGAVHGKLEIVFLSVLHSCGISTERPSGDNFNFCIVVSPQVIQICINFCYGFRAGFSAADICDLHCITTPFIHLKVQK
jgi:hypothetical protein